MAIGDDQTGDDPFALEESVPIGITRSDDDMEDVCFPAPGSIWRHYKGGLYQVIMLAEMHDTRRKVVVYSSIGPEHIDSAPSVRHHHKHPNPATSDVDDDCWSDRLFVHGRRFELLRPDETYDAIRKLRLRIAGAAFEDEAQAKADLHAMDVLMQAEIAFRRYRLNGA